MDKFSIEVRARRDVGTDDAQAIAVRRGSKLTFTRLLRPGEEQFDDFLLAPPSQLAFWLVDNWWRLRYECIPAGRPSPEWDLAHSLASVGGGYVWPRLRVWGEGERVGLACRSDPEGVVGPVRYITDAVLFILGEEFEDGVDAFFKLVADEQRGFGSDRAALRANLNALQAERSDPEVAAWRRLEAQLGLDPDTAPEQLMCALTGLSERYGEESIEEAVQAHPGPDAVEVLNKEIDAAKDHGWDCDFTAVERASAGINRDPGAPPWRLAEEVGYRVREKLSIGKGPLKSKALAALANIDPKSMRDSRTSLIYGLRLTNEKTRKSRIAFRARSAVHKRFELGRAIGDAIWSSDTLGPLARSRTARQKFQRAFAHTLLCPFDDLLAYLDTTAPTDDDMAAAARHFDVSERVIHTILVNKGVLERERFEDLVEAA